MSTKLTIIEFAGIPYAGKTQTMTALTRLLDSRRKGNVAIQEFRGDSDFYESMKMTPEINFLRALNFMRQLVEAAHRPRVQFVLVDRGLYDTHCWFQWFKGRNELPPEMELVLSAFFKTLPLYANRYRVVWMDRNPEEALISHRGGRQGRIVNTITLRQLRTFYEIEAHIIKDHDIMSFHPINSDRTKPAEVADGLFHQLKIV